MARAFRSWLDGKKSGFFAFLRLTDPHWAYECEPYFHGEVKNHDAIDHSFNSGSYGLRPGERGFQLTDTEAYRRLHYTRYPPPVLEHMVLHYDECVRQSDTALGEIFAALRERGIYDDALIVVTSDHGEGFWEHGYLQHGIHLDDVVTRVPLVVKLPGNEFAGTRVSQLVRTVDIMPTVLDALGIPAPQDLDGTSLLPAVREGRNLGLVAYAESGKGFVGVDPELYVPGVKGKWRMIRTDRWKLVHIPDGKAGIDRLYDLLEDPGEKVDVAAQHPDIVEKLKGELAKIQRWETDEKERELSPEEEEQLRQLGYM
ncbi:MAG: hypothetical protein KatS3mg076_2962 [Candidatus Binatia bacterium]|nr:MAG: hypothetical protein KatS3mg076_2962 [Candidatus Binatia bacterium]